MNVQTKIPTTADEFLRWNEGREGKWDFVDGRIVDMMVKVSRGHAIVASNLHFLLRSALPVPSYLVSSADFGVKTASSVRYPDVMVDGGTSDHRDLAAAEPILIAEVLSPSTMPIDFGDKAEEYKTIGTLRHYLVLAQDEPRVWLWSRDADGSWSGPEMIAGDAETVSLPGLELNLPMTGLYAGILPVSE
jgi:Uma2 family endonuclease